MTVAITIYAIIASCVFGRRAYSWVRGFDRHYSPGRIVIAREWVGLFGWSVAWPLSLVGACFGGVIDCAKWAWTLRPGRKPRAEWREVGRKYLRNEDGAELFVYLEGPKDATPLQVRDHCGIHLYSKCEHEPELRAHTIDCSYQSEGYWTVKVQYGKPKLLKTINQAWAEVAKKCPMSCSERKHNWLDVSTSERSYEVCSWCGIEQDKTTTKSAVIDTHSHDSVIFTFPDRGVIKSVSVGTDKRYVKCTYADGIQFIASDSLGVSLTNTGKASGAVTLNAEYSEY